MQLEKTTFATLNFVIRKCLSPFPKQQILDFSKLKEFEDDNFNFDLTLSQTSPGFYVSALRVLEKTLWEKEKLARNEQFLLFPHCFLHFQRTFCHFHCIKNCRLQTLSVWKFPKFVVWERVKWHNVFEQVENTVVKGVIACYDNFSFSHCVFKRLVGLLLRRKNKGLFGKGSIWISLKILDPYS